MDWIAATLQMYGLWLNSKKDPRCWPVWIVCCFCWAIHAAPREEWALVATQVVFLGLNINGYIKWRK